MHGYRCRSRTYPIEDHITGIGKSALVHLNFHTNEHIARACRERGMGDNLTADVHQRMDELVEPVCGAWESNDEGRAIKVFIGKVKEGNNTIGTTSSYDRVSR